ncbi:phospholipase/carboxylesterase [Paracoccus isoporae]|uniref:Phospholipase/carboxylesterase n=1 Tax=Paracoccus isoporae TaxID=591205 RepID=A0A1G6U0U0_9RHOB|nr:VOC family protein [Paracoccus isoporae]SDD34949.1 phospholipase/carboxylesterase [Paracoccus isoporae]
MTSGIHHVTAITRNVQRNVDFYAGFLGLRLVKQTGGYEDAEQLHLIYGDAAGSPGSLVTFLVWEAGAAGRTGLGQVTEIALAIPPVAISDWLQRAMEARIPVEGPLREFGETLLRLKDPDGIIIKLVGADMAAVAPLSDPIAPGRIRGVTVLTDQPDATAGFTARFGYRPGRSEGNTQRMTSDRDSVDIRDARGYFPGIPGASIIDHVAFRAADEDALRRMRVSLRDADGITKVHDRKYFLSLYVREPAGTLYEYATDGPGMTVDEPLDSLGTTLMIPPGDQGRAEDLRLMLPQFARPGEERIPMRELSFIHRIHTPDDPDGSVIFLLHGTGGNEADLMPLAAKARPGATLLGVRGRSTEEGINRWFRRYDAVTYDQEDIAAEAEAFAAFVDEASRAYGLSADRISFLGYSNGANLMAAIMQLQPGVIRRAVLLRAVQALDTPPQPDLAGTQVLMLTGTRDPFARMAPPLEEALNAAGAALDARLIEAGHELAQADIDAVSAWMTRVDPPPA